MAGYAATGKVIHATWIVIYRLDESGIAEAWEEWDQKGWLEQLAGS